MTEHQKNFHDHLVNRTLENHLVKNTSLGTAPRGMKGKLNNLMIQLGKNCNHPDLLESSFDGSYFYPPVEQIGGQCGKFQLLDWLLTKLLARRHKYFSEKGLQVCRIDGNVKLEEKKRQINDFNDVDSNYRIFLLSTRAGGLGINLTAADTCIIYGSDWNPQMDLQAMDRCHRIGQTKPVHVYRLATAQSVEGRMLKRAFSKLRREHVVISKGQFKAEGTMNDISEKSSCFVLQSNRWLNHGVFVPARALCGPTAAPPPNLGVFVTARALCGPRSLPHSRPPVQGLILSAAPHGDIELTFASQKTYKLMKRISQSNCEKLDTCDKYSVHSMRLVNEPNVTAPPFQSITAGSDLDIRLKRICLPFTFDSDENFRLYQWTFHGGQIPGFTVHEYFHNMCSI